MPETVQMAARKAWGSTQAGWSRLQEFRDLLWGSRASWRHDLPWLGRLVVRTPAWVPVLFAEWLVLGLAATGYEFVTHPTGGLPAYGFHAFLGGLAGLLDVWLGM